ncbi:hypothetical protein I4U23_019536 [Adineta vaga]|nr:hypothetical protein I4U23_019536 [Adineta vaga]
MSIVNNYAIATILCLQTICFTIISTVGQYIYASYLQTYPYSSNVTQNQTIHILHSLHRLKTVNDVSQQCIDNYSNNSAQLWAQEQAADLFFRIDLWNSCPMVIMTFILGIYTPKLGRRFVLILPMLGTAVQLAIWLAIIYLHLADYWWYIASFIVGLSGSTYIFNFVLNLIITDNTTETNRSARFVLYETITTAVYAIITFGIGYYIKWRGFTDLYWISLGLEIISIGVVIIFFKNTTPSINETSCQNCTFIFQIFSFKNHSRQKSISLLLTLFAYIFYLLSYSTYTAFLWYLLDAPFCWSSENIGNYTALSAICCAIFSLLGMKLFTRLGANDIIICTLSHLFFTASSLWIAFAQHSWQLYTGLLISPYADYQSSLTIPIMSTWLAPHERNHVFTLVAEVNTIVSTFGESIFNWIYAQTVAKSRNFTLFISAGLSLVAFILNICLFCVNRQASKECISIPSETEPLLSSTSEITHSVEVIRPSLLIPHLPVKSRYLHIHFLSVQKTLFNRMTVVSSYTIATVLSLQTLCTCIIFTLGQYIYTFYLQTYALSSNSIIRNLTIQTSTKINSVEKCFKISKSQDAFAQAWAQQRSADLFFSINLWSCFPIIIMTYILGLYTPKLGRRFVLILPMVGITIQVTIWLAIIYFHLPEYWWYIAAFIVGLSGSDNIRNFVLNLFITENTIESERSSRFVVFGGISMIVAAIGTFVIGYYIACLLLTLLAYASFSFICTAFTVLLLYLLNAPFCWTSKHIGNFSATALITFGILSVLGMKLLTKLGASDTIICIISHIFFCLASLWLAFAKNDLQMYLGLILSSFSGYQNFLTLSMISKWLEPHERTNAFTLVTEINTIMKVTGYCFFNWIYARTVIHYKNFTFLLAAGLCLIPLVLNICLWYISRSMMDEDSEPNEEIDLQSEMLTVPADWPAPIGDANSLLIPQQFSDLSRTSSIASSDEHDVQTI